MSLVAPLQFFSVEEYLRDEALREVRHEYLNGTVHAMEGASRRHNRIARRIENLLTIQFGNGSCEAWTSGVKLHIQCDLGEVFYYPDVMVVCDPADNHESFLEHPSILFEVLAPSTEQIDRREKFQTCRSIHSLEHYVIVAQEERRIEWLQREGNSWKVLVLTQPEERLEFPGQKASLTLAEIYEGIEFP